MPWAAQSGQSSGGHVTRNARPEEKSLLTAQRGHWAMCPYLVITPQRTCGKLLLKDGGEILWRRKIQQVLSEF